jgi:glycosyltransferase involved in cell wall biosynthesis
VTLGAEAAVVRSNLARLQPVSAETPVSTSPNHGVDAEYSDLGMSHTPEKSKGSRKLRIAYHHRTRSTDAQRVHIYEMVNAMRSLGHDVDVISLVPIDAGQNDPKRDAADPFWTRLMRRFPYAHEFVQCGYNLVGLPLLVWKVIRHRADFIYERYALFNCSGVLAARICGLPLILEVNSPLSLEQSRDKGIRSHAFGKWAERLVCSAASQVIVVSTPLGKILEGIGVPSSKIQVIPNGVNLEDFRPRPGSRDLRKKMGLENNVVIGFVGWFRRWHGLEVLLEAFHESNLSARGVKVLLIGDGPVMPVLKEYVEKAKLEENVQFTGPLRHSDVPEYLDLIDIAVQPTAVEYCSPMKILEYMALGKCIVAPRQENVQELLREGEEAQFFTPGDVKSMAEALTAVVADRAKAARMGRQAREAIDIRGFLWTENARRVIDIAEGFLQARKHRESKSEV